jgi:hypothetical protein
MKMAVVHQPLSSHGRIEHVGGIPWGVEFKDELVIGSHSLQWLKIDSSLSGEFARGTKGKVIVAYTQCLQTYRHAIR